MNNQEKIEFAKQQIDKVISSGKRKEDVYTTVLNTAKSIDLADTLFLDLIEQDITTSLKVLQKITNSEVKERLQESFFSYLKNQPITEYTILGLYSLGRSFQESFFLERKELLDNLTDIDDYAYDALIKVQEHILYINYIEMCYAYTGIIPDNTEKLINSDIRTNSFIQEKLMSIETEMYESEDYDNLFFLASCTNSLDNVKELFKNDSKNIYEIVKRKKCKQKTYYYAYFIDSQLTELEKRINWYEKLIKETINKRTIADLIITRYLIRLLELDNNLPFRRLTILPDDSTKKYVEQIDEEDKYEIFKLHAKLFSKTYMNPDKYKTICEEDPKWNPFKSIDTYAYERVLENKKIPQITHNRPLINFRNIESVAKYLEKEKEVLKQESIVFAKSVKSSFDSIIRLYFTSILHYTIPFGELLENFNKIRSKGDFFLIYNTLIEGIFEYENDELYLNTQYGKLRITYTEESNLESRITPCTTAYVNISSYGFDTRQFRIVNFVPQANDNNYKYAVVVSRKVRRGEDYAMQIEEIERPNLFSSLCRADVLTGIYCYLKTNTKSHIVKNELKQILKFRSDHLDDDNINKYYYEYILGRDKEKTIENIAECIRTMLDKYSFRSTEDLTRYKDFDQFRTNAQLIFRFLKEFDEDFYKDLINYLDNNDLLSITYIDTNKDYYKELLEKKNEFIREFYKVYPTYSYQLQDIKELSKDKKDDLKLYLYLKILSKDLRNYDDLENDILNSFKEDNRFIEWIKRIDLNIQLMNKENLLYPLKGLPYTSEDEDKKNFIELAHKLLDYSEEPIVGTTLKELIRSIQYSISDERLKRIEELSLMELPKSEKMELVIPLIEALENTNCTPISRLNLLKALGKNNPFYSNVHFTKNELKGIDRELNLKINSIAAALTKEQKIDLYFLSPQHLLVDTYIFAQQNKEEIVKTNYLIKGTVNINNRGGKMAIYPTNVLCKETHLLCNINTIKNDDFSIIPHYDEISFRITGLKDRFIYVEPVLSFEKVEEQLKKSLDNYSYFESLYREEKEQILMHYCRKDVVKAYEFDKDKIISQDTYLDIAKIMSTYSISGTDYLYLTLLLDKKELFNERFLKINKINERQEACLALQRKILECNEPICFDRLIIYLNELNCLHDVFLLEEAKEKYKDREVFINNYKKYNEAGLVESGLRTYDLKEFISIKSLEFEKVFTSYGVDQYLEKYMNHSYPTDNEIGYTQFLIYQLITLRKEIKDEYYKYLKEKKEIIGLKEVVNDKISNNDVKQAFKVLKEKANSYEDYQKIIEYAKIFPFMTEELEKLIAEDRSLYPLLNEITIDKNALLYLEKRLTQDYNILKKTGIYSPYYIKIIEFVNNIINKLELYKTLDRKEEAQQVIDFLLKNIIHVKSIIRSEEYYPYLTDNQIKLIKEQTKTSKTKLEESIKIIPNSFNLTKLFNSEFYKEFVDFCYNIEDLNKNNASKEEVIEEIKKIEEVLEQESNKNIWVNILFFQFKIYGLLNEELLYTQTLKDNYLKFINENREDIIRKQYLKNIKKYFELDEEDLTLYKEFVESPKKELTKIANKYRTYYKKNRFVKEISFQKNLFDKFYEFFNTLKLLRNNNPKGLNRMLETLVYVSMLDKSFVPEGIDVSKYTPEQLESSKTKIIDADYYLLDNYSKKEQVILDGANAKYKYYIYLVLCYWNKKKIDYKIDLVWNEEISNMLKDFIVIALYEGINVEEFLDSLEENDIRTIIDEDTFNNVYVSAVKEAFAITEQKTEWSITSRVLNVLKKNPLEKKDKKVLKEVLVNKFSEEQFDIVKSYFDIEIKPKEIIQ